MDEVAELKKRIRDLEGQHKGLVAVNAVLRERPDLPIERLPVAREIAKMVEEMAMLRDEKDRLHEIALFLFGLLDDIDTASDEAKDNHEWYRKRVEHIHRRRFEVMETDGYTVKVKNG